MEPTKSTITFDKTKWIIQETKSVKDTFIFFPGNIGVGKHSIIYKAKLRPQCNSHYSNSDEYRAIKLIKLDILRNNKKEEFKPKKFELKLSSLNNKLISLPEQWDQLYIPKQLQKEILIHLVADNPNIVHLTDVYHSSDNCLYLVMEYCEGGNLFDYWNENYKKMKKYKAKIFEKKVAFLFRQIMYALNYCHKYGIIHRDIRPTNIMLVKKTEKEENIHLKLIDFSLSEALDQVTEKKIDISSGFPLYVAPEIFGNKQITDKCDIWSAGVILYMLLTGEHPFNINNGKNYKNVKPEDIYKAVNLDGEAWNTISFEAKDLLSKMICVDSKRLSAENVLKHEWFTKAEEQKLSYKNNNGPIKFNINAFSSYVKLNGVIKSIFRFLAEILGEEETKFLQKEFKEFDKREQGFISFIDFKLRIDELFKRKYSDRDIKNMFDGIDDNFNGKIEYREFLACAISKIAITKIYNYYERLRRMFSKFDENGDGKISRQELESKLLHDDNDEQTRAEIEEFIKLCDNNSDGMIDFEEFQSIMKKPFK